MKPVYTQFTTPDVVHAQLHDMTPGSAALLLGGDREGSLVIRGAQSDYVALIVFPAHGGPPFVYTNRDWDDCKILNAPIQAVESPVTITLSFRD